MAAVSDESGTAPERAEKQGRTKWIDKLSLLLGKKKPSHQLA